MPLLLHYPLDPFSRRMRLALAEYGIAFELGEERPWAPTAALIACNPAATVPVYVEDGGAAVSGIEAMTEYLEETRSERLKLIPGSAAQRAEVRRLAGWFDTKFYAEVSEPVITEKIIRRFMPRETGGGAPDMTRVRYGISRLRDHLDYIGTLADHRSWLAGEDLSIADLAAAAHFSVIDYLGDIPWTEYPVVKAWYQRIKSRPSFRPLLADHVRGMSPPSHYTDLDF
ncbi:MAG: glutathione S-transferase family protein [Aestuariivirga sp.]